jgi:hypothetical protein
MTQAITSSRKLTKAQLVEIRWNESGETETVPNGKTVTVQFNPASLRVSYSNQVQTNDQSDSSSTQYVGKGSSKMSLELIFDVSMPAGDDGQSSPVTDVRKVTEEVAFFMTPKQDEANTERFIPPGVRFVWGTFMFEGIAESMDETLELWSEDGIPLRATVTMNLSQQGVVFGWNPSATPPPAGAGPGGAPGTAPLQAARAGDSVQGLAARAGKAGDWKQIASANGIENPRNLPTGQLLNLNIKI